MKDHTKLSSLVIDFEWKFNNTLVFVWILKLYEDTYFAPFNSKHNFAYAAGFNDCPLKLLKFEFFIILEKIYLTNIPDIVFP